MSFIRNNPVNIGKYLPNFIQDDKELGAVLKTESAEHNAQRLQLQDILDQFFVDSATWGLSEYEQILDITPAAGANTEQRRNEILLKLQGKQTSTLNFMTRLIKHYCSGDAVITITEDNPHNMFHVINSGGSILYSSDMMAAIDTYKPAHLAYEITLQRVLELRDDEAIFTGLIHGRSGIVDVKTPLVPDFKSAIYSASVYATAGIKKLQTEKPIYFKSPLYAGIYQHTSGRRIIGGIK